MLKNKTIAVVIPAFNEEVKIGSVIDGIPQFVDDIIVIDDGSHDRTSQIVKEKGAIVVRHRKNKGVGAAFKSGVKKVLSMDIDLMVNIDADGQFNPQDISKLLDPIINGEADFVTASRFIDKNLYPTMSAVKFHGNKFMSWFISKIIGERFYDVSCGFRAYSKETLQRLNLFGQFTYTQETFIDLAFKEMTIQEVPIKVRGKREVGKSRVASNILKYGYQTLSIIVKTMRDYKPLQLFGFISTIVFLLGCGFGVFLLQYYFVYDSFSPHKWAGFVAGFLIILSFALLMLGFILDMFSRMRDNQEKIIFMLNRNSSNNKTK
jgi:glycosyltransferase involved in cell wall biosynthesis